jgi:hypothetical protein
MKCLRGLKKEGSALSELVHETAMGGGDSRGRKSIEHLVPQFYTLKVQNMSFPSSVHWSLRKKGRQHCRAKGRLDGGYFIDARTLVGSHVDSETKPFS